VTTATLTGPLVSPSGQTLTRRRLTAELVSAPGSAGHHSTGEIIERHSVVTDNAGAFSLALPLNSEVVPAGTFWRITCGRYTWLVALDTAGTYAIGDPTIQVISPEPPGWVPLAGPVGPAGPAGVVQAVNGKSAASITLTPSDVGAVATDAVTSRAVAQQMPGEITLDAAARMRWGTALGKAAAGGTASLVLLGDSITDGWGATARNRRFAAHVSREMRARYGKYATLDDGIGTFNPFLASSAAASAGEPSWQATPWTITGSPTWLTTWGPRMMAAQLSTGAATTLTAKGDRVRIWYGKASSTGQLTVTIKQGATTLLTANVDTYSAANTDGYMWDSGRLTLTSTASITVRCEPSSGGAMPGNSQVIVADHEVTRANNGASGVQVFEFGHYGWKAQDYAAAAAATWDAGVAKCNPDAVVVWLGTNDANASRTGAQFAADLTAIVTRLQAITTGADTLPPAVWLVEGPPLGYSRPSYREQTYAVAAALGCGVIDLGVANPATGRADFNHPSDAGHEVIGAAIVAALDVSRGGLRTDWTDQPGIATSLRAGIASDSGDVLQYSTRLLTATLGGEVAAITPGSGQVVTGSPLGLIVGKIARSAQVLGPVPAASALSITAPSGAVGAGQDLANDPIWRVPWDYAVDNILTEMRLVAKVSQVGSAGTKLRVQLSANGTTWDNLGGDAGDVAVDALGTIVGAWRAPATPGAQWLRVLQWGGDGATVAKLQALQIQWR